jgi:hypothetical protein
VCELLDILTRSPKPGLQVVAGECQVDGPESSRKGRYLAGDKGQLARSHVGKRSLATKLYEEGSSSSWNRDGRAHTSMGGSVLYIETQVSSDQNSTQMGRWWLTRLLDSLVMS